MKRILLLGTGGTIACKRTDKGLKPVITSDEILSYVPDSQSYCEIHSIQLMNIDTVSYTHLRAQETAYSPATGWQ